MKYPYLKVVHEEVADGGISLMLIELTLFCCKTALFIGIGWMVILSVTTSWAVVFAQELPNICKNI